MQYDPIKHSLGKVFNRAPWLRKLFYFLLNILLLRSWYVRREIRRFTRQSNGKKNVLDAGSGFGQYSWFMARIAPEWTITGIDVKPEQISDCRNFFNRCGLGNRVNFREADLVHLPDQDAYDLVITIDVMEHIAEDEQVFRNFFRAMKKPSMLLISTPSDKGGSDARHSDDPSFIDEHVRNGYSMEEITEKLYSAGFSRVETLYSYGTPGHIAWILTMKYPVMMLNASRLLFLVLPFWYLLTILPALILNFADLHTSHRQGTGLIVKAFKE